MNQERLMQGPLPVNRLTLRVVRPAAKEDIWQPQPKLDQSVKFSSNALATADIPQTKIEFGSFDYTQVIGRRRGRLTVIGYAAEQSETRKDKTRWVVRCDCGNYEHRKKIMRWLTTDVPDSCRECAHRMRLRARSGAAQ